MSKTEYPERSRIYDVTLRDGNHALRHSLSLDLVRDYCQIANVSSVDYIEIGHGNGLGASSALVGFSRQSDLALLSTARENLPDKLLAVHCIPGFATISKDVSPAIDIGVDVFRIASHVTEADTTAKHIDYVRSNNLEAMGVLMMSHMASLARLVEESLKLESYGATAVILMDSAGHYTPNDVRQRLGTVLEHVGAEVGFHAHNNLGCGIANSLAARSVGASILDGASMGLGAGSGNAQLECLIAVLSREETFDYGTLDEFFLMSELIEKEASAFLPRVTSSSLMSANSGVFSGDAPMVRELALEYSIRQEALWRELGARSIIAGQESMIREVAIEQASKSNLVE